MWSSAARSAAVIVVDREEPRVPFAVFAMSLADGEMWTADIPVGAIGDADLYGFCVEGPADGRTGSRFDPAKLLLDPEALEVWFPPEHDRDLARVVAAPTLGRSPFGVLPVAARAPAPVMPRGPRHALNDLVIYEVHVRGASVRSPNVAEPLRGTYAGLAAHADHIARLGITAIELLPVHQFDPAEGNYWGYMPLAWNALHNGYAVDPATVDAEFRAMVTAFHERDIEVILDVVYNHTTEEDHVGPTYHLRAIDDGAYYVLHNDSSYRDDAGCGNVVRAAHPAAQRLVLDSLRRFIALGVDGFRFDLASLLGRSIDGTVQTQSDCIDAITQLAAEHDVRLIAEPWDLSAYQVGDGFPGHTWAQWNGKFRDGCRSFLRAENGAAAEFAGRILGSPDLYPHDPGRSINFITAHDGFTLYDLVSYERKHNDANGQSGLDGTDDNRSWNCGWEGDDFAVVPPGFDVDAVVELRLRQMKNAFVFLVLSAGVPMIVAGDEFAQTQHGNNNPHNQDNETTWLDWSRADDFVELTDFAATVIALRRSHGAGPIELYGVGADPDLEWTSHSIAWRRGDLYVMANAWWEPLTFAVQPDAGSDADADADAGADTDADADADADADTDADADADTDTDTSTGPVRADEWRVALSSAAATGPLIDGQITLAPRSCVVLIRNCSHDRP